VPDSFDEMGKETAELKCSIPIRPNLIYSNNEDGINLTFRYTELPGGSATLMHVPSVIEKTFDSDEHEVGNKRNQRNEWAEI
jgi:hypothetical protein